MGERGSACCETSHTRTSTTTLILLISSPTKTDSFTHHILRISASQSTFDLMHRLKLDVLKAKLPSKTATGGKKTFYLANSTTFAGVQTALNVFQEVAGKTGVVGLQEGVKALVFILGAIQVRLLRCPFLTALVCSCMVARKHLRTRTTLNR